MDSKQLFGDIVTFLSPYQGIWYQEVLQGYPTSLKAYPDHWIAQLDALSLEELWRIDSINDTTTLVDGSLKSYYNTLVELGNQVPYFPKSLQQQDYTDRTFFKVKNKKRHEIEQVTPIVEQLKSQHNFSQLIDIGGGQGHLARIIASYHQLEATSIDCCQEFQDSGKRKLGKYPHYKDGKGIKYINHLFGDDCSCDANYLKKDALTIGLHTCGPLALRHMEAFSMSDAKSLINFGCCYLRMNPQTDTNVSNFTRIHTSLTLSKHSLTLATRAHSEMSLDNFKLKKRVKQYRNMLHLLLGEKLEIWDFVSVGDSHPRDYWGSFYNYVCAKFKYLKIPMSFSQVEVEEFFTIEKFQKIAREMFLADIIRWKLGRLLEIYILLDRKFWLEEQNINVEMYRVFDENISPRNIALIASKKISSNSKPIC